MSFKFNILTIFPRIISCFFEEGIIKKAVEGSTIELNILDIRDFSTNTHKKVDDYPYGGGEGMVIMPDPVFRAVESLEDRGYVIYTSPRGTKLSQKKAKELASYGALTIICGRYEGIDQRIIDELVDEEISIGDYVLTGGELPAAVIVEVVSRFIGGVLGDKNSTEIESFDSTGLLEYDQYTRPAVYRGFKVPDTLLSGHHENIKKWRDKNRLKRTLLNRLDIIIKLAEEKRLTEEQVMLLKEIKEELEDECN